MFDLPTLCRRAKTEILGREVTGTIDDVVVAVEQAALEVAGGKAK